MPSRNRLKVYVEGGFYHVYNRGVEKRIIFADDQDYKVFLHLFKRCLSPALKEHKLHPLTEIASIAFVRPRPFHSLVGEAELVAYVLMPNHFHLFVKQLRVAGMTTLVHKVCTMYVRYFNKKYQRVGHLFQEVYKAVHLTEDAHFLHLSRYFHSTNPQEIVGNIPQNIRAYPYSSYGYFLGKKKADWIHPEYVLECFQKVSPSSSGDITSYQAFVEQESEFDRARPGQNTGQNNPRGPIDTEDSVIFE